MTVLTALPAERPDDETAEHAHLAPVIPLVPLHEHTWALRDTEYENGFSLNRFECDGCSAVRFT